MIFFSALQDMLHSLKYWASDLMFNLRERKGLNRNGFHLKAFFPHQIPSQKLLRSMQNKNLHVLWLTKANNFVDSLALNIKLGAILLAKAHINVMEIVKQKHFMMKFRLWNSSQNEYFRNGEKEQKLNFFWHS